MKQYVILIGLSFLLCIIGFFIRDFFLSFSTTYIMGEKISFEESFKLPYQTFSFLLFILSFGIIPFLYLLVKKLCELDTLIENSFQLS